MKNLFIALIMLASVAETQAQFKVGLNAGIPVGDASDYYNFSAGLDVYYMFGESRDGFLKFGATSGIINYFGDDDIVGLGSIEDVQFIPIAAAGRVTLLSTLTAGVDVGYGIGINIEDGGGPYGRAVLGLDLGNTIEVNTYYQLVKVVKGMDFASVGLGLLVEF